MNKKKVFKFGSEFPATKKEIQKIFNDTKLEPAYLEELYKNDIPDGYYIDLSQNQPTLAKKRSLEVHFERLFKLSNEVIQLQKDRKEFEDALKKLANLYLESNKDLKKISKTLDNIFAFDPPRLFGLYLRRYLINYYLKKESKLRNINDKIYSRLLEAESAFRLYDRTMRRKLDRKQFRLNDSSAQILAVLKEAKLDYEKLKNDETEARIKTIQQGEYVFSENAIDYEDIEQIYREISDMRRASLLRNTSKLVGAQAPR